MGNYSGKVRETSGSRAEPSAASGGSSRTVAGRHRALRVGLLATILIGVLAAGSTGQGRSRSHTAQALTLDRTLTAGTGCERSYPASRVDQTARSRFPIRVQPRRRYLVDRGGKPFLIQGDAAWSLIAELKRSDVDKYLADRKKRGFNTLLVNLLEHRFATHAPANAYGDAPFTTPGDYSTPNDAYFDYAGWVLRRAAARGFLVLLTPSYVGYRGSDEGWWNEMVENGPQRLQAYGRYLGRRFAGLDNIIWVEGGDDDPPIPGLVDALAAGISDTDPNALQTAHTAPESAPLETWDGRTWLDVNNVYTYKDVYGRSIKEYRRSTLPFFLIESAYEGEHSVPTRGLRIQAWQALLAGATGQVFGNNPIWHFSGPGLFPASRSWQQALDSPGARSMTVVADVFGALPWWRLIPDEVGPQLVARGRGSGSARVVAGVSCDGRWGLLYLPDRRTVTLDLGVFKGSSVTLIWIDPTNAASRPATPRSAKTRADVRLSPPGKNADGGPDWLLRIVAS